MHLAEKLVNTVKANNICSEIDEVALRLAGPKP
jgi:hypothetical protein